MTSSMTRAAAVAVVAMLLLPGRAAPAATGLLVTVGEVTATSVVVWTRGAAEGDVAIEYGPAGATTRARATLTVRSGDDLTGKLRLDGLVPATRYGYRVQTRGESVGGEFVTAPGPETAAPVTFLWSGDLGGQGFCRRVDTGYRIFDTMARLRPEFFLFLGDTIYADSPCDQPGVVPGGNFVARTLAGYRDKHRYNRADAAVQRFSRATSVYAIWDDHEVRNDFSGPTEPLMPAGRRAFLEYWPILPPPEEPGRLYRSVRWGALLELFILDTRQYRSPNAQPDGPSKTMLGPAQRRWLVEGVASSAAVWKVVATSVPLSVPTGGTAHDSWSNASVFGLPEEGETGFAVERDAILGALRARGVKNLVFLAADVHHAEVVRHAPFPGWTFHELIAGPLEARHGRPRPLDEGLNPRTLFARGGANNFGSITIDSAGLTVRIIDEDGAVLFTHTIATQ